MHRINRVMAICATAGAIPTLSCVTLENNDLVSQIIREALTTQLHLLLWEGALWGVIGGILGTGLGVAAFFAVRALQGYKWQWRHAKWFRALAGVITILGMGAMGTGIGLAQGVLNGSETILRKSQLATEVFPVIGDTSADLLCYYYVFSPIQAEAGDDIDLEIMELPDIAAFQEGTREINVEELMGRYDTFTEAVAMRIVKEVKGSLFEEKPDWRGGRLEKGLDTVLLAITTPLVKKKIEDTVAETASGYMFGADKVIRNLFDTLPAAAKRRGDPDTISHRELSHHVVQEGLVPAVMLPVRHLVRGQQLIFLLIALGIIVGPAIIIRTAELIRVRRAVRAVSVVEQQ